LSHSPSAKPFGRSIESIFFDLAGAAAGCLLLLPLLKLAGGPGTVIVAAAIFAIAAFMWHDRAGSVGGRVSSMALALALAAFLIGTRNIPSSRSVTPKGSRIANEIFSTWNDLSRVGLVRQPDGSHWICDRRRRRHSRREIRFRPP
jgi:hypothetical protein